MVLVGDAAGYVDALTGEGLSLALEGALALARALPYALAPGREAALSAYVLDAARRHHRYEVFARLALGLARRPDLRRAFVREASRRPRAFARLVGWAVG